LSYLGQLKAAKTPNDLAAILGFTPSGLTYVLHKMPAAAKYTDFEIPKRGGGMRKIRAPAPQLHHLQSRLANVLYGCIEELEKGNTGRRSLAHGFERNRSIMTNASVHKRRRYVLNLDLEDFFPSINFGRVRGFFIKDKHFALSEAVATAIAQIACHENELPQGSPSSPVVSNLIGHLLDTRLARFAKKHKCTYSRYADDITFSTNKKDFPAELAARVPGMASQWELGAPLADKIANAGFHENKKKTRMQCRGSRQVVTGLMVNEKVNIRQEYYRTTRMMCHELFKQGTCYRMVPASLAGGAPNDPPVKVPIKYLSEVEGRLAHIYQVKGRPALRDYPEIKKAPVHLKQYRKFLFYKHFIALQRPLGLHPVWMTRG
jgi:RNA-directed DNA polymerase